MRTWLAVVVCAIALFLPMVLLCALAHAHVPGCRSRACDRRVHQHRVRHWLRTHRPWVLAWQRLSAHERQWARCIASYETRGIPWAHKATVETGNGYYGSTQWLPSTWHSAGGSGLPTQHSLHEQLVRTVRWAHVAGSSQWSTSRICGAV